ncbi:MAG: heme-binding domain-containing protein [Anaerolineae bacterium]|nr:heme-binding domain-containing protein [Anaerolineae bacterium]
MFKKAALIIIGVGIALFVLIQFVPYGRDHNNPPITQQVVWDSPQTEALARRACYDCHSNETVWPWYSNVAPMSWLVAHDVEEARLNMDFSEQDNSSIRAEELIRQIESGKMPPPQYTIIHSEARLSDAEKQQFIDGIQKTFTK